MRPPTSATGEGANEEQRPLGISPELPGFWVHWFRRLLGQWFRRLLGLVQEKFSRSRPPPPLLGAGAERQDAVRSVDGGGFPWSAPAGGRPDRAEPGICWARRFALGHASVPLDDNVVAGGSCNGCWWDARGGGPSRRAADVRTATTLVAAPGFGCGARGGRVDAGPRDAAQEAEGKAQPSCQAQVQFRPRFRPHGSLAGEDALGDGR